MILPNLSLEKTLWQKGIKHIVGIDEVGRGAWAGPLVAAGVILSKNFQIPKGFADSKHISFKKREEFAEHIIKKAIAVKIVQTSHNVINTKGIVFATQSAFLRIITTINPTPNYHLIDAFCIKYLAKNKQTAIIKGDQKSASIAAASIIAKVYRDNLMCKLALKFPKYGFEKHKGYGTKIHQQNIKEYGFTTIHRTSYNLDYLIT